MQNSTNTTVNQGHKVSAFHPFIFQKSGKSTIIRNLAVPRHFVAYLVFISSICVDPGPTNRDPTSLLALKIHTPVANTGKLRSIGQVPVQIAAIIMSYLSSTNIVTIWTTFLLLQFLIFFYDNGVILICLIINTYSII